MFKFFIVYLVTFSLFLSLPAQAEEWDVGSMEGFAPYNFERNGVYDGIDTRILNEAAKRIGVTLKHHPRPWNRAVREFKEGKTTALFQLSGNGDWFDKYHPVGPIRPNKRMLFVPKKSHLTGFKGYASLRGMKIGVIQNFVYGDEFDTAVDDNVITPVYFNKLDTAIRSLLAGGVDGVIETYEIFRFAAKKENNLEKFRPLDPPISENVLYFITMKST